MQASSLFSQVYGIADYVVWTCLISYLEESKILNL